ncbi:MAG: hypothetical protein JW841_18130 [Deltaproteobacteria bacterium]|nr:hypothetical protein [Deltaproteobacteria bacterium]
MFSRFFIFSARWSLAIKIFVVLFLGVSTGCFQPDHTVYYKIEVTVTGLNGSGLVLQENGTANLAILKDGTHPLVKAPDGYSYNVTVKTQPKMPAQTCTVSNGQGVIFGNDVSDIVITCSDITYQVSATVTGLVGSGLVLGEIQSTYKTVNIDTNGTVMVSGPIASGASYLIDILAQPTDPWQTCTIDNGSGALLADTTVNVACTTNQYAVKANISGLKGSGLVLAISGQPDRSVKQEAMVSTLVPLSDSGIAYEVTVKSQPINPCQTCTVTNGTGKIAGVDATVYVDCITNQYKVGGTISGYDATSSGLVLSLNDATAVFVVDSGKTSFQFKSLVTSGEDYSVNTSGQPNGLICSVSNGTGTIASEDISDISVNCSKTAYSLSVRVTGLTGSGLVLSDTQ